MYESTITQLSFNFSEFACQLISDGFAEILVNIFGVLIGTKCPPKYLNITIATLFNGVVTFINRRHLLSVRLPS